MRPWVKLDVLLFQDPRFLALKGDPQRLAYVAAVCAAKLAREEGRWPSRDHLEAALGRLAKHVDALVAVGLLAVDGDGGLSVADWTDVNRRYASDEPAVTRARKQKSRAAKAPVDDWTDV